MNKLFCFGLGYSAKVLCAKLQAKGWEIAGTSRSVEACDALRGQGFDAVSYMGEGPDDSIVAALKDATHLLVSISPPEGGDPVLSDFHDVLAGAENLRWVGYLSTVGVYGDHQGEWIDENTEPRPVSARSKRRIAAEDGWMDLNRSHGLPVHIFRIAGIYGPGRSPVENLKNGTARRIVKPGQVFNRIHVDDIAHVLMASMERPNPGAVYNVTDNEPAPPQDVVAFAANVLDMEPPPLVDFEDADLSPMGRSFYGENKRVSNRRIREELGLDLAYPTYREGVRALSGDAG